jgi:hypothetical protein
LGCGGAGCRRWRCPRPGPGSHRGRVGPRRPGRRRLRRGRRRWRSRAWRW